MAESTRAFYWITQLVMLLYPATPHLRNSCSDLCLIDGLSEVTILFPSYHGDRTVAPSLRPRHCIKLRDVSRAAQLAIGEALKALDGEDRLADASRRTADSAVPVFFQRSATQIHSQSKHFPLATEGFVSIFPKRLAVFWQELVLIIAGLLV